MTDILSTIKEPRFYATCNHCNNSFGCFTMSDLYQHLEEHQIGIHFSDVRIISNVIKEFEYTCGVCDKGFNDKKIFEEHQEEHDTCDGFDLK